MNRKSQSGVFGTAFWLLWCSTMYTSTQAFIRPARPVPATTSSVPCISSNQLPLCLTRRCGSPSALLASRRGPDMPAEYWEDSEHVLEELKCFLEAREEEEARILAQKQTNGIRKYLGLSDVEEKRIRQRESLLDREVYGELRRYGYSYLVVPIMQQGGFRVFSKSLTPVSNEEGALRSKDDGGLALGSALEEKMAKLSQEAATIDASTLQAQAGRGSAQGGGMADSEEDLVITKAKEVQIQQKKKRASWLKAIILTEPQKAYVAVLALSLAVAFGRATEGAVGKGLLSEEAVDYARLLAQASVTANALSLPALLFTLVGSRGPQGQGEGEATSASASASASGGGPLDLDGSVVAAWMAKALVCGPLALLQARNTRAPAPEKA